MAKVVTLGEIMLRLSSPLNSRLSACNSFDVCYGGGEANVAVSLAHYGHDAYYVSKLPNNPIGEAAYKELRKEGVNIPQETSTLKELEDFLCQSSKNEKEDSICQ